MKVILVVIFVMYSGILFSQKRYDCIIHTNGNDNENRYVGSLYKYGDSTITIITARMDTTFNYKNITSISFRKHNGFMRTVLPLSVISSYAVVRLILAANPTLPYLIPLVSLFGTILYSTFVTIPIGTVIYFATRNHVYKISNYDDYKKLMLVSNKYIVK